VSHSPESLVVIGAGGHGSEILTYLRAAEQEIELLGFVDDNLPVGPWRGSRILGGISELDRLTGDPRRMIRYITAVGSNEMRRRLVTQLENFGKANLRPWTLCHPTAIIGNDVVIDDGTCLAPGSIVTANAKIGRHVIMNVKASVSHDCVVGDFANLNPGVTVCGNVKIGDGCYIGAGATIIDKVAIGEWTVVGAGAVVISDLPPRVTAVGVPARIVKHS
jgi:sugar O-acyltransferase (sialic acid O-acetyltransferase NeuD family)